MGGMAFVVADGKDSNQRLILNHFIDQVVWKLFQIGSSEPGAFGKGVVEKGESEKGFDDEINLLTELPGKNGIDFSIINLSI